MGNATTVKKIPIDRVVLPSWGDLRGFRDVAFESALLSDIQKEGVIARPIVRPHPSKTGFYECLDGWSRIEKLRDLGVDAVECDVRDVRDVDAISIALKMNIMRKQHDAIGMAKAFRLLHEHYGMRYADVAERFGYSRGHVYKVVKLLELPKEFQDRVASGDIPFSAAMEALEGGRFDPDVLLGYDRKKKACDFCHRDFEAHTLNRVLLCRQCSYLLTNMLEQREKALREELEREARVRKHRQARLSS